MRTSSAPVGAPPYPKPWPDDPRYDPELLANGDKRNVIDKYRYWSVEAIKKDLDAHRIDLHIAIENWQHDINIGTIVRNANAFNVAAVHIIGKRHWNRRGAMVTDAYMHIHHHASVAEFVAAIGDREVVAIDNVASSQPLGRTQLPQKAVLVFGSEGPGLSQEMIDASKMLVAIEQLGSTRSVNVGVASGIILYEWARQHKSLE